MLLFDLQTFGREPALIESSSGRAWSYLSLCRDIEALGELLPRDRSLVFCFCRNDAATVVGYLASLLRDMPVVLLDASAPAPLKERLIELYRPGAILEPLATSPASRQDAFRLAETPLGGALWTRKEPAGGGLHPELSLLLSTSGTTGSPKLVRLAGRSVRANAESIALSLGLGPQERAITSLPIHYSYGLSVVNSHLASGGCVVLNDDSILQEPFWKAFRLHGCTSLAGVPYTYQLLARIGFESFDLPALSTMTQAGGRMPVEMILRFDALMKKRGGRLFVMYGQTEATARIACLSPEQLPAKAGSVGRAIPGGALSIEDGEIIYRGPNVMLGYAENARDLEKSDELKGILRTGDLGHINEDGLLYITGRLNRFCKLYGLRINLDEIENELRKSGPSAVRATDEKIVVFCENGSPAEHEALRQELARSFRLHPSSFEFRKIDALPLKPSGKIDYSRLTL